MSRVSCPAVTCLTQAGNRVRYNQSNYRRVYEDKPEQLAALIASEEEPSLSEVVQVTHSCTLRLCPVTVSSPEMAGADAGPVS